MKSVTLSVPPARQPAVDARADALLQQLLDATPAQIDAWLAANVTTLAQARGVLRALAVGLRAVYRNQVRQG